MKIIIYALNFKPELVGIGKYTGELADFLNQKGHKVCVITAPKYYPEWEIKNNKYSLDKKSDYKVYRCPIFVPSDPNGFLRIIHLISFSITSFPILISQIFWKPSLVISIAPSLISSFNVLFLKLFCPNNFSTLLHIQDFELDAAFNLNILNSFFLRKLLSYIEIKIFKNFQTVSTISNNMIHKLIMKGLDKNKIKYFPNWVDLNEIQVSNIDNHQSIYRRDLKIPKEAIVIQYSGTLNKKQGLNLLIEVIRSYKDNKTIYWLVACEGPSKKILINRTKEISNIKILKLQKRENMSEWLNTADIHIIPQEKEAEDLVFPSKLLPILASGNPFITNANQNSELGKIAKLAGIRVDPEDFNGFKNALQLLINDKNKRLLLGKIGRKIAKRDFNKLKILNEFNNFINKNK